jgi:hypothetical protein
MLIIGATITFGGTAAYVHERTKSRTGGQRIPAAGDQQSRGGQPGQAGPVRC